LIAPGIEHIVFFLEGPSEQDFLKAFLPAHLPSRINLHYQVFQGKQDMEKRLALRMRGWRKSNTCFVVLRDQDSGDCIAVKNGLKQICSSSGHPNAVVRIACRELETFFVGDWKAVATAFGMPALAKLGAKAMYRQPDLLGSPSAELKKHISQYQKRDGARRIGPHLDPTRNRSQSFGVFMRSIQQIAAA
jgi:Domain of unknown function (DUF4276)